MIVINDLHFTYQNTHEVLHGVSFRISQGEFVALIGQNGAGKTTLLKQFNGLLTPTSGSVQIAGIETKTSTTSQLSRQVGFLFQNPDHQIFMPTVFQEIGFGPKNLHLTKSEIEARVYEAAEAVGLTPFLNENPLLLSKGQRQRVAFASVLSMKPEILVLDEPTTGQDYQEGIEIMEMVKNLNQQGHTIVFVTHDMELVATYAKRVIVLSQGRVLLDDTCKNVFYQPEILRQTNLFPPQIARLVQRFENQHPSWGSPLTVAELYNEILKLAGGEPNVECCG
ncbi:MAG TPA: ABC transporter ATP-binding protein [Bacillota bacterium]|nr:ABC transporter ATP-binding protein [Bacillota bacterium]